MNRSYYVRYLVYVTYNDCHQNTTYFSYVSFHLVDYGIFYNKVCIGTAWTNIEYAKKKAVERKTYRNSLHLFYDLCSRLLFLVLFPFCVLNIKIDWKIFYFLFLFEKFFFSIVHLIPNCTWMLFYFFFFWFIHSWYVYFSKQ